MRGFILLVIRWHRVTILYLKKKMSHHSIQSVTHTLQSLLAEVDLNFAFLIDFVFAQYHITRNANTHPSIDGSHCQSAVFGQG